MQRHTYTTIGFLVLTTLCTAKTIYDVYAQSVSFWTLLLWGGLLVILYIFTQHILKSQTKRPLLSWPDREELFILGVLAGETLASLWWFGGQTTHFHYDEFLTASTSSTLPLFQNINWFGVFPKSGDWVCQFPIFFHILQYPFVHLFPSVLGIRMSTWPYTVATVFVVYLLTRHITKKKDIAFYAASAFIFLAPQQYLGSLGLHFHASTFFFITAIYLFIRVTERQHPTDVYTLGIAVMCCCLGYTAAYIIVPLLAAFGVFRLCIRPRKKLFFAYTCAGIITLLTLLPWMTYALRYDNFFLQRYSQVNAFSGTWVNPQDQITIHNAGEMLQKKFSIALSSLLQNQKSGVGDYFFGSLALLDPFSFILLFIGLLGSVVSIIKKEFNALILTATTLVLFIASTVFTQTPIPFHRLSIDFPFFGICIGCGIGIVQTAWNTSEKRRKMSHIISTILIIVFGTINTVRAGMMVIRDTKLQNFDSIHITKLVQTYASPGETVWIAAFSQYHLGKELFFRTNGKIRYITERVDTLLNIPTPKLIIIHIPDEKSIATVIKQYPSAVLITKQPQLQNHAVLLVQ